jgi:hypothetical protein
MADEFSTTSPKPFVFVLMPFDSKFNDIYKFGIKGGAQDAGAYAERIDEQIFIEGMLDRIFNQIAKADVIVADMTGRNPNVFYEVGYAHALNKIVLLLTQDVNDIPFDLKHRQHIVYSGSIEKLRIELAEKLKWAIAESTVRQDNVPAKDFLEFTVEGYRLFSAPVGVSGPTIRKHQFDKSEFLVLQVEVRNSMLQESPPLVSAYLYNPTNPFLIPFGRVQGTDFRTLDSNIVDNQESPDGLVLRYKLNWAIPSLPRYATHSLRLSFEKDENTSFKDDIPMRIRLQFANSHYDYPFVLDFEQRGH